MKIKGYTENTNNLDKSVSIELSEILLEADADELRMISEFLQLTANNMEKMGSTYDHEHLSDANHYFDSSPHLVVVKPQ